MNEQIIEKKMLKNKEKSIFEILIVFILILLICWAFTTTNLAILQRGILGWNYFSHALMILFPIAIIALNNRKFQVYGLTLKNWKYSLRIAGLFCLVFLTFWGAVILLSKISGFTLLGLNPGIHPKLLLTVIFQLFFVGFGEELLFRGYFQSRMNIAFDRSWVLFGIRFGPGLIIASVLFGFIHVLNPFNPFAGMFNLAWGAFWGSFFMGFLFGFMRERTESILAPALFHGISMMIWFGFLAVPRF